MTWLLSILGWIFGKLLSKPQGPSQEAVQAKEAGAAEAALKTEETSNVAVLQAAVARDAGVRSVATDDGLRKYEAADPNNRDAS